MGLYLGLDSSTQSLSAVIIDTARGALVLEESIGFGRELPEFASPHGFLASEDPQRVHADPLLWVAGLERLFERLKQRGFDLASVQGVSGAAQQHGSVYLSTPVGRAPWRTDRSLVEQVRPLLSRPSAPIWLDSSTRTECDEIAAAVGGEARVAAISGSRPIERFTAAQIRAFWKREPDAYRATAQVTLVSAFMASVLSGASAPIDLGDGAGMNLLDLRAASWSPELVRATAPELARRLPALAPSQTRIGSIAPWFVQRYGFAADTPLFAFTGDNPSSLVGMGATEPGSAVISLGTSDTVFAAMREPRVDPRGFGHVFGNPAGGFMCLICFANGSLAREAVAERVGVNWAEFERALLVETEPGNAGDAMLPYFVPEMTPRLLTPRVELEGSEAFRAFRAPARNVRAVVEAQAFAMQHFSDWIGERPECLRVTGGAAKNDGILSVLADVFDARIETVRVSSSAALGAAVRAARGVEGLPWSELAARFARPEAGRPLRSTPRAVAAYEAARAKFRERMRALGV